MLPKVQKKKAHIVQKTSRRANLLNLTIEEHGINTNNKWLLRITEKVFVQ